MGWATSLETARTIATKVALYLQNLGLQCSTPKFAQQALHLEQIRHLLEGGLPRSDAERFRGRLQFASRGFTSVSSELSESLDTFGALIEANERRLVDTRFFEWVHLCVDACYEPDKHSGAGGLLLDSRGKRLGFFNEMVTPALISQIQRVEQKTIIFELEGLAVAAGLSLFSQLLADNQAVQPCLIKCKSKNDHMDRRPDDQKHLPHQRMFELDLLD